MKWLLSHSGLESGIVLANVQGNILKGFNKDEYRFIFFEIPQITEEVKVWFREFAKKIPSTIDLIEYVESVKRKMTLRGETLSSNFRNHYDSVSKNYSVREILLHVSFTSKLIRKLKLPLPPSGPMEANEGPYALGMKSRKSSIGDIREDDPDTPNSYWIEPFKSRNIDGVFIVASNKKVDVDIFSSNLIKEISKIGIIYLGVESGSAIKNSQGKNIEHFGFSDGISQPLIRGIDDKKVKEFRVNNDLLSPEHFVLSKQRDVPAWAEDGSFMVFRKLRQDVDQFWTWMNKKGEELGMSPEQLASKFIGRWKSGAPVSKFPDSDPINAAKSDLNDFKYFEDDRFGVKTPRFAHIRKAYPRDDGESGIPETNIMDNNNHRILRRGITYGPIREQDPDAERGLLFVCYQKDIFNQFEFVQKAWINESRFPRKDFRFTQHGIDPIIALNRRVNPDGSPNESVVFLKKSGILTPKGTSLPGESKPLLYDTDIGTNISVGDLRQWVHTRGGEYFFSPSLNSLKNILFN
jgi:Dyp-type peroxidase family